MAEMKRTVKDSVFTYLFRQPEYTRQRYLSLHPEDSGVRESGFKLVTLENILTTGLYNDLGIQVRARLILRMEGREDGIRAMVHTLKSLSLDRKTVEKTLSEQFGLSPQAAEEKVRQYWQP